MSAIEKLCAQAMRAAWSMSGPTQEDRQELHALAITARMEVDVLRSRIARLEAALDVPRDAREAREARLRALGYDEPEKPGEP